MAKRRQEDKFDESKGSGDFDWAELLPKTFPVPLADLNPYENNPRINEKAIPYVKRSIKRFGFIVPIVVDDSKSLTIAAGHTRLAAALKLCEEQGKDPAEVKVLCLSAEHLSPSLVRQFRLADNRVASFSADDAEKLRHELNELIEDWNASDFGFSTDDWEESEGDEEAEGEIDFAEELCEEHNFVVLYFDNEIDWLQAQTLLGLKKCKYLGSKKGFVQSGIGRVVKGSVAIERIRNGGADE